MNRLLDKRRNKLKLLSKMKTETKRFRKRSELVAKLKNKPCFDCSGWFEPCQMDFDHRNPNDKIAGIASMKNCDLKRLLDEINKCDLVCANCHRLRTKRRVYDVRIVADKYYDTDDNVISKRKGAN